MLRHFWTRILIFACGGVVLVGCASTPTKPRTNVKPSVDLALSADEPANNGSADKRALAHAHYGAAVIHEMNDEPEAALEEYCQAAVNDLENEPLVLDVSRRCIQAKKLDQALDLVSRATARSNASGALFARLGTIQAQMGKLDAAKTSNRTAIRRSPTALGGYQNLFLNYLQEHRTTNAVAVLDEAAKQAHVDAEFLLGLAGLYSTIAPQLPAQKASIKTKTLALLGRAEKLQPKAAGLLLNLADQYSALGESTKAAQLYLELLKKMPDIPVLRERVHAKLTDIYLRDSDHKRATEQLQAILREDPTNPMAYFYLGTLAFEDKKPTEAAEYFRKVILLNPDFESAYYDLAGAQLSLGKGSEALATLQDARKRFPQSFTLEFWLGMAFGHQKAYSEAIEHYTTAEVIASATDPKRLDQFFYFQLGAAHERKQNYAQAEKYFRKCLQLAPDFAEAQNYLGYMWAERGTNLDEARVLIEKAVKAQPKNAAYLDSFGWVLYRLNQPKAALEQLLKAVDLLREPDPTVWDHLGDVYNALKREDKAREAWRKSLALEPNEEVRKKLESRDAK